MSTILHFQKSIISISLTVVFSQTVFAGKESESAQQLPVIQLNVESNTSQTLSNGQVDKKSQAGILGEKDVMDLPFSITSYTDQYIQDQQATTIAEALKAEPSVRNVFSGNGLGEYFNIRGFYTQSHEIAWNGLFGLVPHNRVPAEFFEKVEVFRGTSALLNGMSLGGAIGGVINVVPKRAGQEDLTRLTASYTEESNFGLHLDTSRRFGQDKQFGVRVNALKSGGDTVLDGQEEDRTLGSIALDYQGERLRGSLDLYSVNEKVDGGMPTMVGFASSIIPKAPDSSINTQQGSYAHTKARGTIANIEYDAAPNWTVYLTAGTKDQQSHGVIANNALGMATQPNGDYTAVSRMNANNTDVNAAEAGLRGKFSTGAVGHQIVLSGNWIDQNTHMGLTTGTPWQSNIYHPTAGTNAPRPTYIPKTSDTTLSSVALADTLSFADDKYQVILGLRHQKVEIQNYSIFTGDLSGQKYNETATTPAFGVVLKPWGEDLSLYANYMEGLSQGDTDINGKVYAPYQSEQYEVGAKWDLGRFRNTLSLYQISKPVLINDLVNNTSSDGGEQRNRGVEWTTAGALTDNIRLMGGVAYLDAVQTKTQGSINDGKDAMGIPHWQSNLGMEWDVSYKQGLTLTANTTYTGSMYADVANTQKLPSWTEVDLGGRYSTQLANKNVVFRGGIDNVFNKNHWAGVWNGFTAVSGTPRSLKLSMQVDF
jgi:iron complex outermembrane receptor protein